MRNTSAVATPIPGLTSTMPHRGRAGAGSQTLADPAHPSGPSGQAYRHVGAKPGREVGQPPRRRACRHSRHSRPQAAAASAEPPPMPDATGRCFSSTRCAPCPTPASVASARAARSTRLSGSSWPAPPRTVLSTRSDSVVRRLRGQRIADLGEHHQAVQQVVAIGPPAGHMQVEVDLGGRASVRRSGTNLLAAHHRRLAGPPCSFASSFAASSGSGLKISARRHWIGRLQLAPGRPVGIAEMAVDRRRPPAPARPRAPASAPPR